MDFRTLAEAPVVAACRGERFSETQHETVTTEGRVGTGPSAWHGRRRQGMMKYKRGNMTTLVWTPISRVGGLWALGFGLGGYMVTATGCT